MTTRAKQARHKAKHRIPRDRICDDTETANEKFNQNDHKHGGDFDTRVFKKKKALKPNQNI